MSYFANRNRTTVGTMSVGGALALLIIWIGSYYMPDLFKTLPTGGEAAIALLITAGFSYFTTAKADA